MVILAIQMMEVLKLNKQILQIFGMCLDDETASNKQRFVSKLTNWVLLTISISTIALSLEYIVSHFEDTEDILYAVVQVAANTSTGGGYWTFYKKKFEVSKFVEKMENLVNARIRENPDSYTLYTKCEKKSTFVTKWSLVVFLMDFDDVIFFATLNTIIFELAPRRSDPATWYALYRMSFPFDEHTVHGYFGYLFLIILTIHTYAILVTCLPAFFVCSCFYLDALTEDFDQTMQQLNRFTGEDVQFVDHIQMRIVNAIKFNIQIIKLFEQLSGFVNGIIFFQLLCGAVFASTTIYQLDLASEHINADFFVLVFSSILSISQTLPYCYYSAHISMRLSGIGDSVYNNLAWYEFPSKIQKNILLIIGNSKQVKLFSGYGIINCSLETFKKILNTTGSYYIMLKTITSR